MYYKIKGHYVRYCQKETNKGTLCPNNGYIWTKRT